MRKNLLYKITVLAGLLLSLTYCKAQSSFQYKAVLNDIKTPGFYKIVLAPSIVAKCKNELNDIRIVNGKGNQVPYVLKSDQFRFEEKKFIELPITDVRREADKQTHVVIQNKSHRSIDELLLVIKNTDAERTVSISGSDDQEKWFVIKEHIALDNLFIQQQDRFIQSLNFPKSTYNFFEIIINGKDLLPVNIIKAGIYEDAFRNGEFLNIPTPSISQVDSNNKSSYVNVMFNENYLITKLKINATGPKFFRRQLTIYKGNAGAGYSLDNNVLSSVIDPSYTINIKANRLTIVISNQDNPPVKIQSVNAYQVNKYLLAYLEPGNKYELNFGDVSTNAPVYDLEFFKDSINNSPAEIIPGPITVAIDVKQVNKPKAGNNMIILWIIIGLVLSFLLILTFRMTREVSKNDKDGQV